MRIGSKTPVDALPPNIMANTGTTIMETPGTPVFDIPISMAHIATRIQLVGDRVRLENITGISKFSDVNGFNYFCKKI